MKMIRCFLIALLTCFTAAGQNLFPNPGFETYILCPDHISQQERCADWNGRSKGSPDYYNCGFYAQGILGNEPYAVPASGTGVEGFVSLSKSIGNSVYTEGISAKLLQPVLAGHHYQLDFRIRIATQGIMMLLPSPGDELGFGFYFYNRAHPPAWNDGSGNQCNQFTPQCQLLASQVDTYNRYKPMHFCFTPTEDYDSVYIGVVCTPQGSILPANQYYWNLDDISLKEADPATLQLTIDKTTICRDSCIRVNLTGGTGGSQVSWSAPGASGPPQGQVVNPYVFCYGASGNFPLTFKVSDSSCNEQSLERMINVSSPPMPGLHDTEVCNGQPLMIDLKNLLPCKFTWNDGDSAARKRFTVSGQYSVRIMKDGCTATDSFGLKVLEGCYEELMIPTAFSPNADGLNDIFHVLSNYYLPSFAMRIYNRWGNCVFYSTDYRLGWNGNGQEAGVYFYRIAYTHPISQQKTELKGDLTLVR